jgi:crotonobetainyl-CoA:carnitine CoA-transferase CaiB-like acyl-CoA transferase
MLVHPIGERYLAMQSAGAPHLWSRLIALVGRPELETDPRFATVMARRTNWAALVEILRERLDRFDSVEEAVETLGAARIPAVPMLSPEEVVELPQLAARSAFPEIPHRGRGRIRVTALPFHVDRKAVAPGGAAPYRVGQHTQEVLTELGYDAARIAALQSQRVVEIPE